MRQWKRFLVQGIESRDTSLQRKFGYRRLLLKCGY